MEDKAASAPLQRNLWTGKKKWRLIDLPLKCVWRCSKAFKKCAGLLSQLLVRAQARFSESVKNVSVVLSAVFLQHWLPKTTTKKKKPCNLMLVYSSRICIFKRVLKICQCSAVALKPMSFIFAAPFFTCWLFWCCACVFVTCLCRKKERSLFPVVDVVIVGVCLLSPLICSCHYRPTLVMLRC